MRCPDCASLRSSTLYKVAPGRLFLTALAALVVGTIGAAILFAVGFFVFFIGPGYGAVVAEVVSRASGRKRGPMIEAIGVGGIVIGALLVIGGTAVSTLVAASHAAARANAGGLSTELILMEFVPTLVWPVVGMVLAISACFSRLRYF
jgi:hypothetical protein